METPLEIDIATAAQLHRTPGKVILLDVREPDEYADCHVADCRHIPMGEIPTRLAELPRDHWILVLCHLGGRSLRVTQFLRSNNFPLVTNIAGGIEAWSQNNEPGLVRST